MDYHLISSRNPYRNHRDSLIRMFGWRFNRFVPFHFLGPDKDSYWSTLHYNHIMESNKVISHDISFQVCGIIRSAETLYFPTPFPLSPWCSLQILWGAVSSFSVISQEPRKKVKTTNMLLLLASTSRELREKVDETPEFIMIYLHCVLWLKKKTPHKFSILLLLRKDLLNGHMVMAGVAWNIKVDLKWEKEGYLIWTALMILMPQPDPMGLS